MPKDKYSDSFDLIAEIDKFNSQFERAWTFHGNPMRELSAIERRKTRELKRYGARLVAWKIVRMRLNMRTGNVSFRVVSSSDKVQP